MFAIEKKREGDTVTLRIRGILNTKTAPDLSKELDEIENDHKTLPVLKIRKPITLSMSTTENSGSSRSVIT